MEVFGNAELSKQMSEASIPFDKFNDIQKDTIQIFDEQTGANSD